MTLLRSLQHAVPSSPPVATGHFECLTAFRGIAAIIVVVFHFSGGFLPNLDFDSVTSFIAQGYLWVDFFFMLSGFVIAHAYLETFRHGLKRGDLRRFVFSRFARIYPLHAFILAGFICLELFRLFAATFGGGEFQREPFDGGKSVDGIVSNALMLQATGIHDTLTWNGPAWSIGAEWFVYLGFPLLAFAVTRMSVRDSLLLAAASALGLAWISDWGADFDVTYDYGLWRCGFGFIAGVLLRRVYPHLDGRLLGRDGVCIAIMAVTALAMHHGVNDILVPPLFALLIMVLAMNRGRVAAILGHPALLWLGTISYAIYLSHMLVLETAETVGEYWFETMPGKLWDTATSWLALIIFLMIAVALADLLHRTVERRCRKALLNSVFANRFVYGT